MNLWFSVFIDFYPCLGNFVASQVCLQLLARLICQKMLGILGMCWVGFIALVMHLVNVWMGPVVMEHHVHSLLFLRSVLVIVGMLVM